MNKKFSLYLDNGGCADFGTYKAVALLPTTHIKGNTVWLPYHFIADMTKAYILCERRDFKSDFATTVLHEFGLTIDKKGLSNFPLIDSWKPYQGQEVDRDYKLDKCFPIKLDDDNVPRRHYIEGIGTQFEWYYSPEVLFKFYNDPRFQGLLLHAGFIHPVDQLEFSLFA